jgi:tellurite resistance protein TehA-like permease
MPNIDKALADLAAKLGTKAELLWPQLVAIQRLNWFITLGIVLVFSAITPFFYLWFKRENTKDDYNETWILPLVGGIICGVIALVALMVLVSYIPSQLMYPEIGAAKELLGR